MSVVEERLQRKRAQVVTLSAHADVIPDAGVIIRVAATLRPHLYDGTFAHNLGKMSLFTPEQAEQSAARKREEHELDVAIVLHHYLNPTTEETP